MNRRPVPAAWLPLLLALVVSLAVPSAARAVELMGTEDLMAIKDNWPKLVGTDFRVEVRVKLFGPRLLTVLGSDLQFRSETVLTRDPKTNRYEVVGTIQKEVGTDRYYFVIRELKPLPSDHELLREKRSKLNTTKPEQWYEVADWGMTRAAKYDDADLREQARDLYQKGLETEYGQLMPRDAKGIRGLIAKLDRWKLSADLRMQMVHEAFRAEYEQTLKVPQGNLADVLSRIGRDLAGSEVPLAAEDAALREQYRANSVETYRTVNPNLRPKLHRALYVDVYRDWIERDADPQGRNGVEIAKKLAQAPELAMEARQYREKEIAFRLKTAGTMPRQEMLAFAKGLDEVMDARGKELRRQWLASRERRLIKDGVNGLVELGDESLALLDDRVAAVKYYQDAERTAPNLGIVADRFRKLGYVQHEGRWIPKEDVPPPTADPFYEAVQAGRVSVGMLPRHVKAALGSEPDELVRMISGAGVKEWWTYKVEGISVEFEGKRLETSPPRVSKIISLRGKGAQ